MVEDGPEEEPAPTSQGTRARRRPSATAVIVTGIGGVVFGIVIFAAILAVTGDKTSSGQGGKPFVVGKDPDLRGTVARHGPLLFQDLVGDKRHIYVQHLGDDRWAAFEARPPGAAANCVLEWQPESRTFTDPCGGPAYPADGTGLVSFPTRVDEDSEIVVDLRQPMAPTQPATTTNVVSTRGSSTGRGGAEAPRRAP